MLTFEISLGTTTRWNETKKSCPGPDILQPKKSRHFLMDWTSVKLTDNFQISELSRPCLFHIMIKFVSDLRQVGGFLWVLWFLPPNKTDLHNITEIVLKVALNTIISSHPALPLIKPNDIMYRLTNCCSWITVILHSLPYTLENVRCCTIVQEC